LRDAARLPSNRAPISTPIADEIVSAAYDNARIRLNRGPQ